MAAVALPPFTLGWAAVTGLQALVVLTGYSAERKAPAAYSKFAAESKTAAQLGPQVSSRVGMLIIYTPALIASALQLLWGKESGVPLLVSQMLLAHFAKRDLEVLFLHKYSGGTPVGQACAIGVFYLLQALMCNAAVRTAPAAALNNGGHPLVAIGTALFVAGQAGNLLHHWLLARLRPSGGGAAKKYVVPEGGLFRVVTAPHYLFELVSWYGVAAVSRQLNVGLGALSMTAYLCARAANTTEWYRTKMDTYPSDRRHIIPFVF